MVVVIFLTVLIALLTGAYLRPLRQRDKDHGATLGRAIRNTVTVQFGEAVGGQAQWEFGPPPPSAILEPAGGHVVMLDATTAPSAARQLAS